MNLSRRQFNRGAAMLTGAAAMPQMPVSMKRGSDDAYEAIISEFVRVEEAAHAAGTASPGGGAVSLAGRQLEGFISHLDMSVNPLESSGQVFRELRGFLKEKSRKATDKVIEKAETLLESPAEKEERPDGDTVPAEADETPDTSA